MQIVHSSTMTVLLNAGETLGPKQRIGVILPVVLVKELGQVTNRREKSQFVVRAIAKAIDEEKSRRETEKLAQQYEDFSRQSSQIAEDWHTLDLKDWGKL